jgi:hypothetical protein
MADTIAACYSKIREDSWREENGFTQEFNEAQDRLLIATPGEKEAILAGWLQRFQPCLFGRIAAKSDLITYCILDEHDLTGTDEKIRDKIQQIRTEWTRQAYEGRKSGFVILACSPKLSTASPDEALLELAVRLGSLYLLEEIEPNTIYTDEIFLEVPGTRRMTWRWNVGVNFFGAAGDGRWWRDHRIPAGIAFSMNSVGHLVKSGQIATKMCELAALIEAPTEDLVATKVDSLPKALDLAMRTINMAADTPSGKATSLMPLPSKTEELAVHPCPVELPPFLRGKNYCEYEGYYHTDETIPAEYFTPSVDRDPAISPRRLDFTYLFHSNIENPDFVTTGTGRRVRDIEWTEPESTRDMKSVGRMVEVKSSQRLWSLLNQR